MDIKAIQDKLNEIISSGGRKIVFWYDDDASYVEEIDDFQLANGCELIKLDGRNNFTAKLLIEKQHPEKNYLVYAPFARPSDNENPLADIFYYSDHFYSDKLIQMMGDLDIPIECQDEVKKYKKFWNSSNTAKFTALSIEKYKPETVTLGVLCVLAGIKAISVEELVRKVILSGEDKNSILEKFENNNIIQEFWKITEKYYGYKDVNPTVTKFMVTMIVTYMDTQMNGHEPEPWKSFVSTKNNDAFIFVKNLMNNEESKDFYDSFSHRVSGELNVPGLLRQIPLPEVLACDALEDFDKNLIKWIIAKLEDNMLDEKIAGLSIPQICEARSKVGYHFASKYDAQYKMLVAAHHVLKEVSIHMYQGAPKDIVEDYVNRTYLIDTHYRKFYYYLDKVGLSVDFENVKDLVENAYTNKYLADSVSMWNQSLTDEEYDLYSELRQQSFFDYHVKKFMEEQGGGRVVVIISDGMRYECARELYDNLQLDEKCDATISHMLSVLPSETTLGMASLLPNVDIVVDDSLDIHVDGMHCGNSTPERQKILQKSVPRSACYDFDVVKNGKQAEIREMFQDKDLVYIYQNQIDTRGEHAKTENEVFNACQEAIEEIQTLIRRLTGYISNTRYLVTADHGFIYKRDKIPESDKISFADLSKKYKLSSSSTDELANFKNKRYLLSQKPIVEDAMVSRCMAYLTKLNEIFVSTPVGADIIKLQGGGQNYVHGGSSLQEMVVPVIKVTTFKGKQETGLVDVQLSTISHRVTNVEVKLAFMQMEAVTDKVKPRRLQAFFVDADGAKVSFPVPITANITSTDAKDRLIEEKFTFKTGKYNRGQDYFLILADQDDETKELYRYKFEIDISDMAH